MGPEEVAVDGGVLGMSLLPLVEECSHLLVLDAVDAEQPAGTLLELAGEDIPLYNGVKMSEHQVGFQEVLAMAKFRERFPAHLYMVGVQPADLSVRVGLSPEVTASLTSSYSTHGCYPAGVVSVITQRISNKPKHKMLVDGGARVNGKENLKVRAGEFIFKYFKTVWASRNQPILIWQ